jgi:hypothetical protein
MKDKQRCVKLIEDVYALVCDSKLSDAKALIEKSANNRTVNIPPFIDSEQAQPEPVDEQLYCMVALKGEPAKRMLRTEAQELQRQTKDTHDWFHVVNIPASNIFDFDCGGTYTYAPKQLKQVSWTGSREDVIALLKELEVLK